MPDNEIYKFLKENNLTQLDEKAFINKYSAPDKAKEIHSFFVENDLTKLDSAGFYDKYLKKKASGVASVPTESKSQLPSYLEQGKKMAQTGFATPQIVSEDVKTRKEPKIRISPKLFGTPGVVDVDIVEEDEDGSYKNLAQNLINNFLISASDIGAGLAQILRDGAPTGVPREKKKTEALYTEEGKKTPYAKTVTWAQDPLAKVALGLNGISEPIKELQQTPSAKLPDTFVGNTLTSLSAIVPDLAATALLPEAKAIQGASFLQKTGSLLFNNFTKYLMVKEPLVGYNEAKMKGEDQSAIQVLGNVGKGAVSGMELALLGAGSSLATKGIMNQAKKVGLVGTKGFVAKELANLATDVVAYGLISPSISTLYEEGRLPNSKEISEGAGIALAFRLKDAIPSIRTFRDLNKAVDDIQQAKQGAALYNFLQATPESIVRVYNGKESANELHLKAMVAAKEAKDAVDPVEKQKAVIQASTMAKAANVKQMTDMFVQDKGLADYIQNNESLPMEARLAIAEKANLIRKSVDPIEIKKEQTGQRMQQGQRLIQDLTLEMNGEQDPVKKAELQFRINQTEKGLKMQENELMSLIEGQAKEAPLDLTDINTVKQSKKSFNEQIDLKLEALDKNDPDYFEKVEGLNKQREERNDYFDRVLEDKKQEEKGISVMTPEEFNQVENVEVSLEGQKAETPVEEIVTEVKPTEVKAEQGKVYRAVDNLSEVTGPDRSFSKGLEWYEGDGFLVEANESTTSGKEKSSNKGALRGVFEEPTKIYYQPEAFVDKEYVINEINKFKEKYPNVEFVRIKREEGKGGDMVSKIVPHGEFDNLFKTEVKPTEAKPKAVEVRKQKLDQENRLYTTKTGRQKVEYENGQLIVRDVKTGKEVSPDTRKKALEEYIENFDFSKGKRIEELDIELPTNLNEEEGNLFIADNSSNPLELVELYSKEPKQMRLSGKEQMIAEAGIGTVDQNSFNKEMDRNLKTGGIAFSYFRKGGSTLDDIASQMERRYGVEFTPKDIGDFMINHPRGSDAALREGESRAAQRAAERFKELTGLNLDNTVANKIIDAEMAKAEAFEQELIKQEYETREQLEAEYYKASAEADRLAEEGNRPTAESTEKTTAIEAKKELTLQDIYETLPKSEKLRNEQVKEMVNKNFDSIVKQLEKYKIC
jgi:hypothetical protein